MGLWAKILTMFSEPKAEAESLALPKLQQPADNNAFFHPLALLDGLTQLEIEQRFLKVWLQLDAELQLSANVPKPLKDKLLNEQYRQAAVPRLPTVLPKLMRALRDPDTAARDCVALIKQDAALLASVLQIANSAVYRPSGMSDQSIEQAVVSLGLDGLRRVVCEALLKPIAKRSQAVGESQSNAAWQYSVRTAMIAEELARINGQDGFLAYLLGLCQGLGYITLSNEFIKYSQVKNSAVNKPQIAEACLAFAATLSAEIVSDWPMPRELLEQLCVFAEFQQVPSDHTLDSSKLTPPNDDSLASTLSLAVYASQIYSLSQHDLKQQELGTDSEKGDELPLDLWSALAEQWGFNKLFLSQLAQSQI
ncbi:HDOD domain-containing protein [uncultured Pseudoteredinibacter sp.]|uniref:HDOD domain-containing protein n=1 Tax=uncultured Pseudoteredinibacter sp. TaxID=1641701 RepID=UPI0026110FD1|nr:HDOD domain-containing protein [uncultured Pseudoteredinibacter sp.]